MNVLQILSDQHAAHLMGCEGHPQAVTPHLDLLASTGTRFTRAYCQNPICTPSRVSYLSGQYCQNHRIYGLSGPTPGYGGVPPLPSFLQHFRCHGYRTAIFGKTHLPDEPRPWARDHVDEWAEHRDYLDWLARSHPELRPLEDSGRLPEYAGGQQLEGRPSSLPFDASLEAWTVDRAVEFMRQAHADGKRFCIQASFYRPHQCHTPDVQFWNLFDDDLALPETFRDSANHRPPTFRQSVDAFARGQFWAMETYREGADPQALERVARRIWKGYLACIAHVDHAVGRLVSAIEELGVADETVITYGSDHGAYCTAFGLPEKAPGICSELVCRIPMIWRVPGGAKARVCDALVESVDLAATLPALCGLPPMQTVDGRDISKLLHGSDEPVRAVAVTENMWSKSIRWGPWRLVHYPAEMFPGDDVGELYNIESDPCERVNLYASVEHAAVVAEGRKRLLDWLVMGQRVVSIIGRGGPHPLAADGRRPNSVRDDWRADWEIANYI